MSFFTEAKIWYLNPFKSNFGRFLERCGSLQPKYDCFKKLKMLINTSIASEISAHTLFHNSFMNFWWLSKFFFDAKWNAAWLLIRNWYLQVSSLRLRMLGNHKISKKTLFPSAWFYSWKKTLSVLSKNLLKNRKLTFPVLRYFTWNLDLAWNTFWMIVGKSLKSHKPYHAGGRFCHSHSLEIQAAKLRFLLIYEIMLKSIGAVRSEGNAK